MCGVIVCSLNFSFVLLIRLPEWAAKAINGPMEYIAQFDYKTYADTPELARLKSGFLLKEMLEHFSQKINSTLKPNRSLWLYSGHDLTILNMLNTLGLYEVCFNIKTHYRLFYLSMQICLTIYIRFNFQLHISPYAASLHFELYKNINGEYYVQVLYRKSKEEYPAPMNIPKCGEKCPLNQFYAIYSKIIPGEFESECRLS